MLTAFLAAILLLPAPSESHVTTRAACLTAALSEARGDRSRFVTGFRSCTTRAARHARSHRLLTTTHRASWYGPGLYGNRTACGATYTPSVIIVAHRSWRCGKRIVVCYRGRCSRAVVGDRGPYHAHRSIDLSAGLAQRLRFSGVAMITIRHGWLR
jgi:rare lipoprotein A